MVPLARGADLRDRKGTLAVEDGSIVFLEKRVETRWEIPLSEVRKVRRLRGSPVLMVHHGSPDRLQTAFYFTQPPPLHQPETSEVERPDLSGVTLSAGASRRGKKAMMRGNLTYLSNRNVSLKLVIDAWVKEIRRAVDGR